MSLNNYLHIPKKNKEECKTLKFTHYFEKIEFYKLGINDKFKFKNKVLIKNSDETALTKNKNSIHFWPQDEVRLIKKMKLDEINKRYPITQYEY